VLQGVGLNDQPLCIIAKTYKGAAFRFCRTRMAGMANRLPGGSRQSHCRTSAQLEIRHRRFDPRANSIAPAEPCRTCGLSANQL